MENLVVIKSRTIFKTNAMNEQSSNGRITLKEMADRVCTWSEFYKCFDLFKFSPYGSTTLDIPEFHKKNIINIVATAGVNDYQYSSKQWTTGPTTICP